MTTTTLTPGQRTIAANIAATYHLPADVAAQQATCTFIRITPLDAHKKRCTADNAEFAHITFVDATGSQLYINHGKTDSVTMYFPKTYADIDAIYADCAAYACTLACPDDYTPAQWEFGQWEVENALDACGW